MLEERIRDLIEEYQNNIETIEEELRTQKQSFVNPFLTGRKGVYGKVVKDLKDILEGA